jgi:hypothetical protein
MLRQDHDNRQTVLALSPVARERGTAADTLDIGHGRIKQRRLQTSDVLRGIG